MDQQTNTSMNQQTKSRNQINKSINQHVNKSMNQSICQNWQCEIIAKLTGESAIEVERHEFRVMVGTLLG